jgi:hypothetical protein
MRTAAALAVVVAVGCGSRVTVESADLRPGDAVQLFELAEIRPYCAALSTYDSLQRALTQTRDSTATAWTDSVAVFKARREPATRIRSAEANAAFYRNPSTRDEPIDWYSPVYLASETMRATQSVDWGIDKRITLPKRVASAQWIRAGERWHRVNGGRWGTVRVVMAESNSKVYPCSLPKDTAR